jgi:hypothetical protein
MTTEPTGQPAPVSHGYFASDDHALLTGFVIGAMMKAGITVRPETDENGNFLPKLTIQLPALEELGAPIDVCIRVLPGKDEGL